MAQGGSAELLWDPTSVSLPTRTIGLAAFAVIYALLVALGYGLTRSGVSLIAASNAAITR
jgi:hypothetical protein